MKRRDLIRGAATVIPASVALQMLGAKWAFAQEGDFDGPVDALNYALTLEYLEAEFYRQGNAAGLLEGKAADYLQTVQSDEEAHVMTITDTIGQLGGDPVPAPQVDFGQAFQSGETYLETAFIFENLGVSAYLGAAPSLFLGGGTAHRCGQHLRRRGPARGDHRPAAGQARGGRGVHGRVRDAHVP